MTAHGWRSVSAGPALHTEECPWAHIPSPQGVLEHNLHLCFLYK